MDYDYHLEKNTEGTFDVFSANTCKTFATYDEALKYLLKVENEIRWSNESEEV